MRKLALAQQQIVRSQDERLLGEIARSYQAVYVDLQGEMRPLLQRIEAARANGEEVSQSWLFQQARYQSLQSQVVGQLRGYGIDAEKLIAGGQRSSALLSQRHVLELVTKAGVPGIQWASLPTEAIEAMVGRTISLDVPLSRTLRQYPAAAAQKIKRSLISGVALGHGPDEIARSLRRELGSTLSNYMTLARTETMKAYTTASLTSYRANQRHLQGWEWLTAKDERVCPTCGPKDGKIYPLSAEFDEHPNGRCSPVPVLN